MEQNGKKAKKWKLNGFSAACLIIAACAVLGLLAAQFVLIPKQEKAAADFGKTSEELAKDWENALTEDQLSAIDNILEIKKLVAETDDYVANSKYMQLDGYNVNTLTLMFSVSIVSEDEAVLKQVPTVAKQYVTYVTDGELLVDVAGKLQWDAAKGYYSELITSTDLKDGTFNIVAYYPEAEMLEEISQAVQDAVNGKIEQFSIIAPHKISLIRESIAAKTVQAVIDRQNSIQTKQAGYVKQITTAMTSYEDVPAQNNLYYYKAGLQDGTDYSDKYIELPEAPRSKKLYYAIGLVGGIALGVAIILLVILFDIRLVRGSELLSRYHFPYIGSLGKKTSPVTAKKAVEVCKENGLEKIVIIGTTVTREDAGAFVSVMKLAEREGIKVFVAGNILTDAEALVDAEEVKSVFVAEQVGIAKHKEIEQEIASLKACGITVAAALSLE